MFKKIITLCILHIGIYEVKAHDFTNSVGGTVVDSFDLSGSEIWHGYFLPENVLLAQPQINSQQQYHYINHPAYRPADIPTHREVCIKGPNGQGTDLHTGCKDEFPHVHIDDFKMALDFANDVCNAYGPEVVPDFNEPTTFVGLGKTPAASHHYYYQLSHGLKFDCVALATY